MGKPVLLIMNAIVNVCIYIMFYVVCKKNAFGNKVFKTKLLGLLYGGGASFVQKWSMPWISANV
jgi:hypothetical protein